jgi:hypothetical protein
MIGLQEMLMQTIGGQLSPDGSGAGGEIRLLPAWPADWDVDFRLHAPGQTVVTCSVRGGRIVRLDVQPESRRKDVVLHSSWAVGSEEAAGCEPR